MGWDTELGISDGIELFTWKVLSGGLCVAESYYRKNERADGQNQMHM